MNMEGWESGDMNDECRVLASFEIRNGLFPKPLCYGSVTVSIIQCITNPQTSILDMSVDQVQKSCFSVFHERCFRFIQLQQ